MIDQPRRLAWWALSLVVAAPLVSAHEGHKKKPSPSPTAAAAVSGAGEGESPRPEASPSGAPEAEPASEAAPSTVEAPTEEVPNPLRPFPWKNALTEHLHNKIVHFPLAFGLAAALILLVGPRYPVYEPTARVLLVAAGLAGIAAFFTGRLQREPFEDTAMHQVLVIHQFLGIATTLTLWVGAVLTGREGARKAWRLYALLLLAVLSATGLFGGLMSHGSF